MPIRLLPYFLAVFYCLVVAALPAQSSSKERRIDSLTTALNAHPSLDAGKVDLLNQLGYEYWITDPAQSIKYGTEALEIAKILEYDSGRAFANRVVGVAHWAQGNLDLAFRFLIAARKAYQALQDSLGIANSSLNLGMAYVDQGNTDLASRNYEDALVIFRRLGADSRIATTYTKIADLLMLEEKYPPAADYLNQALDLHRSTDFLYGIAEANGKLGQLAAARGELDDAISYFLVAVAAGKQRNDHFGLSENYLGIGRAYYRQGKVTMAENYFARARSLAEQYGLQRVRRDVYLALKDLEASRGNYRLALSYAEAYRNVKDSIFNREKSNLIANMEARRTFEAQQEQLKLAQKNVDLLQQKNKINRLTKWLLLLGLFTVLAIAFALLSRKNRVLDRRRRDLDRAEERKDELESALVTKDQELTSYTLNFVQKNEGITELKQQLEKLRVKVDREHRPEVRGLIRRIDGLLRSDDDWIAFRQHFESAHPNLISSLGRDFPGLTTNEFRLIALIRLNLSSKEISTVLGISPNSVKTARYRLRKKLGLDTNDNLFDFLLQRG
ncbi:MAG: tetratricopeptide repeat protein [Bacteroidota bacterium]